MKFWDSSAIVPLLIEEKLSDPVRLQFQEDADMWVWWGATVECASAIERGRRQGGVTVAESDAAYAVLASLARGWREIRPSEAIRDSASRFLRVHPLRAADALQLAAAFAAAEGRPATLEFLSLDERLVDAARREGFRIVAVDG